MSTTIAQPFDARTDEILRTLEKGGQYKHLQTILSPMDAVVRMRTPAGKEIEALCFCSNNYLGLANHPEVVEAGIEGLRKYGAVEVVAGRIYWPHEEYQRMGLAQPPSFQDVTPELQRALEQEVRSLVSPLRRWGRRRRR